MNVNWWLWIWCVCLINLLMSQLISKQLILLGVAVGLIVVTALLAARDTQNGYRPGNIGAVVLAMLGASALLLPFGGVGITVPLINTISLPEVLLRPLYLQRLLIVPWLVVAYLVLAWAWGRFVIPRWQEQFGNDWQWDWPWRLALLTVAVVIVAWLVGDRGPDRVLSAVILIGGGGLLSWWLAWVLLRMTALPLHYHYSTFELVLLILAVIGLNGAVYHLAAVDSVASVKTPRIISHRGVDHHNGVQNTTQALRKTAREHPQSVETDVQETRDHQFINLHDPNLRHLAGHRWRADQRTLKQLKQTTIHEHGHQTTLSAFDNYLTLADRVHIPLIVEIKPQPLAPTAVARQFIHLYRQDQAQSQFEMHSIDPLIIRAVQRYDPAIKTGLIEPFTISRPLTRKISFYSLNYHTINQPLVKRLHASGVKVYAWTVNSPTAALRMKELKIDGIITNNYQLIRDTMFMKCYPLTSDIKNLLLKLA